MVRRLLGAYAVADLDSAAQMAAWRREKPGRE
jgi:hypothetical protein